MVERRCCLKALHGRLLARYEIAAFRSDRPLCHNRRCSPDRWECFGGIWRMADRLTKMIAFVKTAELGSFSAAAAALAVSSQMIGRHVESWSNPSAYHC